MGGVVPCRSGWEVGRGGGVYDTQPRFFSFPLFSFLIHDDSHGCLLNRYIRGTNGSEQAGIVLHTTKTASNPHHKQTFFFLEKAQFTLPATSPPTCTLLWICLTSRELEMEKNGMNLVALCTLPLFLSRPSIEELEKLTVAFGFGMLGSDTFFLFWFFFVHFWFGFFTLGGVMIT